MIKSKGCITNTKIETIRRKRDNQGINEGTMHDSDNIADINYENVDITHADSATEEPITVIENDLTDSERNRLLRLKKTLKGDDFGKRK